jgi:hypothetical protein
VERKNKPMTNLKKVYLDRIRETGKIPNFFMSETYINQPTITAHARDGWVWLEENAFILFPAVTSGAILHGQINPAQTYWASFPNPCIPNAQKCFYEFLDYQYIYDPKKFLDLSGGKWESFRKNVRKFKDLYCPFYTCDRKDQAFWILMEKWFGNRQNEILDGEFILECISNPRPDDYIRYLYDKKGNMVAVNYADESWKYINYRFLICDKVPFADEYARYCFYTDPFIQKKNKLINDGGTLGNSGLEKFKDKLNPLLKEKIYTKH